MSIKPFLNLSCLRVRLGRYQAASLLVMRSRIALAPLLLAAMTCSALALEVHNLRCEYQENPVGIDTPSPRLSWTLKSDERGDRQTAYQIQVASTRRQLEAGDADLWDTRKVASPDSLHIEYAGPPLRSTQHVWWRVRAWDAEGKPSSFSSPAHFETALMGADWQASWIQRHSSGPIPEKDAFDDHPAPLFRTEFTLKNKKVARARAYVSGLGYYELRLNGTKVGNHCLDPGWTTYSKRVLYSTFDVTEQLRSGRNAIGVMLGNGWFDPLPLGMWGSLKPGESLTTGRPRLILQLRIEFTDGEVQTVISDPSWRVTDGPILRNSVYLGEVYDARREKPGWDRPGFDDSRWERAIAASQPAVGSLHAQQAPPIRVTRRIKPVRVTEPKPGVFIFDFGQNFAGWVQLKAKGPAGQRIRLRSGELLYPDGTLNGMTAVVGQIKNGGPHYRYPGQGKPETAFQLDEYILKGEGVEVYIPRFTFHGFRYVEVTGYPGRPGLNALEGLRLNSDVKPAGAFACSNPLLNQIQEIVLWAELSNLFSVQSDCPHREKLAYGGDISVSSEMGMLNFDMATFYAKAAQDLWDAVRPNGAFTETAPFVGIADQSLGQDRPAANLGPGAGPVDYGMAQPLLACQLYQYYGDTRTMADQYAATRRWIELLDSAASDGILDNGISDHESLLPKPRALTGTAFYYFNVKLFAQIARNLGKTEEAAAAEAKASVIKDSFNRKFLQPGTGRYGDATQTCQAFALYFDLVPPAERNQALDVLLQDIRRHNHHLTTGIFGTKYMFNALTDAGQADAAYALVNQKTFPGWGHMLAKGATTLWEHWEFSDDTYSHNHPMFGSVSEWFYKALAGIRPDPSARGLDRILIQPEPVGDLTWVRAHYDSVRGRIVSSWQRKGNQFQLRVEIPIGMTATIVLPHRDGAVVKETGKTLSKVRGITELARENGRLRLSVTSGNYDFSSTIP